MTDMKPLEDLRAELLLELREAHRRIDSLRGDKDTQIDGCRIRLDLLEKAMVQLMDSVNLLQGRLSSEVL